MSRRLAISRVSGAIFAVLVAPLVAEAAPLRSKDLKPETVQAWTAAGAVFGPARYPDDDFADRVFFDSYNAPVRQRPYFIVYWKDAAKLSTLPPPEVEFRLIIGYPPAQGPGAPDPDAVPPPSGVPGTIPLARFDGLREIHVTWGKHPYAEPLYHGLMQTRELKRIEFVGLPEWLAGKLKDFPLMPRVEHFRLSCEVRPDNANDIASLSSLTELQAAGPVPADALARLRRNSRLDTLSFGGPADKLTDADMAGIAQLTGLKHLSLAWGRSLTDAALNDLSRLENLESLNLRYCEKLTGATWAGMDRFKKLRFLNLSGCKEFTDAGLINVARIPRLHQLSVWNCPKLTDDGLRALAGFSDLRALNLGHNHNLGQAGLAACGQLKHLRWLRLICCENVNDSSLARLATCREMCYLDLNTCPKVTDAGLARLTGLVALQGLCVMGCKGLTTGCFESLTRFPDLRSLEIYACDGCEVTDADMKEIARLRRLEYLSLCQSPKVSDAGYRELLNLPELRRLLLSDARLASDDFVRGLGRLLNLWDLYLTKSKVLTDESLKHLAGVPGLQQVRLPECTRLSEAGVRAFLKARPDCSFDGPHAPRWGGPKIDIKE